MMRRGRSRDGPENVRNLQLNQTTHSTHLDRLVVIDGLVVKWPVGEHKGKGSLGLGGYWTTLPAIDDATLLLGEVLMWCRHLYIAHNELGKTRNR